MDVINYMSKVKNKKDFLDILRFLNRDNINDDPDVRDSFFKSLMIYYDYVPDKDNGYNYALKNLLSKTENGSIILMHTLTKSNVNILSEAIDLLEEKGFVFSDLSELL